MTTVLKPLDRAPVKEVRLDTTHKIIEISPGMKFRRLDLRRSGARANDPRPRRDKIRFTMTNRSDESVPGVRVTTAPMMHSMDFHAAMVSPQDKYRSIAPGQTIEFEFTSNYLPMPNQNLSDAEIRQSIRYFKWADAQPTGSLSSSGAGHWCRVPALFTTASVG